MTQQQGNECRIAIGEEYKLEANLTIPLGSKAILSYLLMEAAAVDTAQGTNILPGF